MTETRLAALEALFPKWEKDARHFDDYRGVQSCIRDLKAALAKTEEPLPTDLRVLVLRAEKHLAETKGKPFFTGPDVNLLITDLLTAVKALGDVKGSKSVTAKA